MAYSQPFSCVHRNFEVCELVESFSVGVGKAFPCAILHFNHWRLWKNSSDSHFFPLCILSLPFLPSLSSPSQPTLFPFPLLVPSPGAREGRVRGSADPLKFGAEVRNCIWRLCWTSVKVMAMTLPTTTLYCTNNQHDFQRLL